MATTYVYRTNAAVATLGTKATYSLWLKRGGVQGHNASGGVAGGWSNGSGTGTDNFQIAFNDVDRINVYSNGAAAIDVTGSAQYRDCGAWYHIVVALDTTQATDSDRVKIYVNGILITAFASTSYPTQDTVLSCNKNGQTQYVGRFKNTAGTDFQFEGVMSHFHFIDGLAYAASDFGSFDTTSGIWKIKTGPSVTYGDNGYFLKFEDSSNMDLDSGTNTLTFTTAGTLTATKDNPSNNFCIQNIWVQPLSNKWTFTNGATKQDQTAGDWTSAYGTLGVTKGKWYYEAICGGTANLRYGWSSVENLAQAGASYGPNENPFNNPALPAYGLAQNGSIYYSSTAAANQSSSYGTDFDSSALTTYLGVYLDLDNGKLYYAYDGTIQASGVGHTLIEYLGYTFIPLLANYNADTSLNYGNGVFGATALGGTTYSDDNGEGIFKHSPNDGGAASFDSSAKNFYAVCTNNIKLYGGY